MTEQLLPIVEISFVYRGLCHRVHIGPSECGPEYFGVCVFRVRHGETRYVCGGMYHGGEFVLTVDKMPDMMRRWLERKLRKELS